MRFLVKFLVLELNTHKNNLWVTMVPCARKTAEKDYKATQLSKDGYCISICRTVHKKHIKYCIVYFCDTFVQNSLRAGY